MRLSILSFLLIVLITGSGYRKPSASKIQWMTLAEAVAANKEKPKPILIDLYTDWCGWCKEMDKKTYANQQVATYIQEKFYAVKLDAETREKLLWKGKTYGYNPSHRSNDIAIYLTGGQLSYPTTVIIPGDGQDPQPIPGFLAPNELELIVKYFGEGQFGRVPFQQFQHSFHSSW